MASDDQKAQKMADAIKSSGADQVFRAAVLFAEQRLKPSLPISDVYFIFRNALRMLQLVAVLNLKKLHAWAGYLPCEVDAQLIDMS